MTFRVLFVCTGNVCRSPAAEFLLRARLGPRADVAVMSAGTSALVGAAVDDATSRALGERGVWSGTHRAQQLEPWMALGADLVLTAETDHRDAVMTLVPSAFRRTFTVRELAALTGGRPPSPAREGVHHAASIRGLRGERDPADDDIVDCYQAGLPAARAMVERVAGSVDVIVRALFAGVTPAPRPQPVGVSTPPRLARAAPRPGRTRPSPAPSGSARPRPSPA